MNTDTITEEKVDFSIIKASVAARFDILVDQSKQPGHALLRVDYDRDEIWSVYLNAFTDPVERQEHNCNCCKSFIRQVGGVVLVTPSLDVISVWPDADGLASSPGVRALAAYVKSRPIAGLFYHEGSSAGTDKNLDAVRNVVWQHFYAPIPRQFVNDEKRGNVLGRKSSELRETRNVMKRGFEEITEDALDTVRELIAQNSLYRGTEYSPAVDAFSRLRTGYLAVPAESRDVKAWLISATEAEAICRLRNTAIGTLLVDLSGGRELDDAVKAFERIVAPANYKRPTALVTPRMVEAAKQRLQELGLMSALDRRRLDDRDLTAAHALYVYRPTTKSSDVFAQLTDEQPVNVKELKKVEEVSIGDFLSNILPNVKDVKVLVERQHLGNFVTLTGPQDADANNLMKWDNSFAWSYTGGVADSIKERVKAAGGKVDGWLRASLGWHNHDDLDLHFHGGQEHVYYASKRGRQAWLDVDMNAGMGQTREPVENITCNDRLKPGKYSIDVHQYRKRDTRDEGYELEIEVNGEVHSFGSAKSPRQCGMDRVSFTVLADGQVAFEGGALTRAASGVNKWGVKTGQFHRVRAITLSPNHWTRPIGNKHFMFLLDGCLSDEPTRPFYNEFLIDELAKDRKTTEALAGKIEVAPAQGAELSGLGFSDTQRNHLYIEVYGAFKRTLKINF